REGISDSRVLGAMEKVPRHLFVPPEGRRYAYRNVPLAIGDGQTISQPLVVALMTQALRLSGTERVLEVGTGSGYQCAILAELSRSVTSVERVAGLANASRVRLARLGYDNIRIVVGDGSLGFPPAAPYDAILVTAAGPRVPDPLLHQLSPRNGRMVLPVGEQDHQDLLLVTRCGDKISTSHLGNVRFVPLIGEAAWHERQVDLRLREDL
ncbi:MAG TPA: protein-L-isoaspartate(D-aspartate) O-methyltransferase, partial [Chloroflexota bacterium]|nr:protein-L-isoaspartate(D-aspartate) O-methyltransferase [Chloroflexota bacterium]